MRVCARLGKVAGRGSVLVCKISHHSDSPKSSAEGSRVPQARRPTPTPTVMAAIPRVSSRKERIRVPLRNAATSQNSVELEKISADSLPQLRPWQSCELGNMKQIMIWPGRIFRLCAASYPETRRDAQGLHAAHDFGGAIAQRSRSCGTTSSLYGQGAGKTRNVAPMATRVARAVRKEVSWDDDSDHPRPCAPHASGVPTC